MASLFERRFESDRPIWLAVVGSPDFAEKLASELEFTGIRSHRVIGYIGDEPMGDHGRVRWLGELGDVRAAVQGEGIDLLVVGPHNSRLKVFEQAARDCLDLPVRMIEATALYEDVLGHVPIGTINSAWFQFIMHPRYSPSSPLSKRSLDIIVSGLMLAVSGPFLALAAMAVKLEDRGPIFYRQRRVGEEGVEFDMLKFRTLRADADDLCGDALGGGDDHQGRAGAPQDPLQRAPAAGAGPEGADEARGPAPRAAGAGGAALGPGALLRAPRRWSSQGSRAGPRSAAATRAAIRARPGRCATTSTTSSTARRASTS